ncbi:MAG: recombinase RecT [Proteobacteria bacterium]|nr:recombinase RecT [Pseudomonadota bacterium]
MNKQITTVNDLKKMTQSDYVKERFNDVLGKKANGFVASLLSVVSTDNKLSTAEPKTILNAAMIAATLDLPINQNLGFAYIIGYKNKTGVVEAQFQLGYKGFIQLAMRSGQFQTINTSDVREGEIETHDRLTGSIKFSWKEENRDKLPVIGYIAYFELLNGFSKSMYMTTKELKAHGVRYSATAKKGYGMWVDNFDAMSKKTVLKLLLSKYAPLSTQMQTAQLADQAIIRGENNYEYVDNQPVLPEEVANNKERGRIITHIKDSKNIEALVQCEEHIVDDETRKLFEAKKKELENKEADKLAKDVDEGIKKEAKK